MNDVIHDEDFPADGGWPGARSFINLAELSGLTPAPAGAQVPRRRPIPDRPSRAGVAAKHALRTYPHPPCIRQRPWHGERETPLFRPGKE